MNTYTDDSQICRSTLERTKKVGGVVTSVESWKCYESVGHVGPCHGITPSSPRWSK